MPAHEVFVDTTALMALTSRSDSLHGRAVTLQREFAKKKIPLLTSDWVLAEFLSAASRPPVRAAAIRIVSALTSGAQITVVEATHGDWSRAFEFFERHTDKAWSFVDCSSMLICQDRGIRRVFTYDRHFAQFGLEVLLRP
jgi:predicted nucleic acid-binding protein